MNEQPKHTRFPSPKRSPSIISLLNPSTTEDDHNSNTHNDDYFSEGNGTTTTHTFYDEPEVTGNGNGNGGGPTGFKHLLSPSEPTPSPPTTTTKEATTPSKRKRPRATEFLQPTVGGEITTSLSTSSLAGEETTTTTTTTTTMEGNDMPPPRKRPTSSSSSTDSPLPTPTPTSIIPSPSPTPTSTPRPNPQPSQPHPEQELEPSIFNISPIDEFTREVADWLWGFGGSADWSVLEIEAKIGVLIDTNMRGNERIKLPVPIETILTDDSGLRFESNMTVNQHKSYNRLLNSLVESTASPSYPYAPIRYSHTRETDTFHQLPGGRKIRVTRGGKDGERCVEKVRVADMNVFSPKRCFDWRLSVSLEMPGVCPLPLFFYLLLLLSSNLPPQSPNDAAPIPSTPSNQSQPQKQRHKDRISYSHQLFQIDLTQVTLPTSSSSSSAPKPVTHELEVEFKDAGMLMKEAKKEVEGSENRYLEMVQCFLNNIRMLVRNAGDP